MIRNYVFDMDPDSDGWSVEVYAEPDADGSMDYLGRLDLFSWVLHIEGGATIEIPGNLTSTDAARTWAGNILDKLGTA